MATAAKLSLGVKEVGSQTHVPDNDVARLMYYLNCVTVSCGLDIIQDDLVDWKNYHRLSTPRADSVFQLAYTFSPDELINKVIYLDDGTLCGSSANKFLEIKAATQLLSIQSEFVLAGSTQSVQNIMVFTPGWLERYYQTPLRRNVARLKRIVADGSLHCEHCAGSPGQCSCTSCPRTTRSECTPLTANLVLEALVEAISEVSLAEKQEVSHCRHCKGLQAHCVCREGCPLKATSKCTPYHEGVVCDAGCGEIEGARFKCLDCYNYDLCRTCYAGKKHSLTHRFERIDRCGVDPVSLSPRQKIIEPTRSRTLPNRSPRPAFLQEPEQSSSSQSSAKKEGEFFYQEMSPGALRKFVKEHGESCDDIFEIEDLRRKAWDCHCDSIAAAQINSILDSQNISWNGCSIAKRRDLAKAAFKCSERPMEPRRTTFAKNEHVILSGLTTGGMNGREAVILEVESVPGRAEVRLVDTGRIYKIKHENLQLVGSDYLD